MESITVGDIANIDTEMGEAVATLRVSPAELHSARVEADEVPSMIDELPMLACLAAGSGIDLEIRGAAELRHKESDRIRAIVANLRAIGADADERPDGLVVIGDRRALKGRVQTHGDHRIAMAFAVLGKLPGNEIELDDRSCVNVSYPDFWKHLEAAVA